MTDIASKNLYELLGNTHDEDSDREPDPPVKTVDKPTARTTKRNATGDAPASKAPVGTDGRGPRRGGYQGNDAAFRDRNAGSANNRGKPVDEVAGGERKTRTEGRGGRGIGRANYDRHSRGVGGDSEKQAGHGWGANEGDAELNDEQAAEAIAKADKKEALTGDGEGVVEPEAEPEDNSISYADYLAQQLEKKAALNSDVPEARKPNEGSKQDKKWANAKPLAKEEEEDFVAGTGGKAKRERERKAKTVLEIDQRFVEAPERGGRGGGGFRGGRGGRGDGPSRGRGEGGFRRGGRGEGDRGRGGRGEHRGAPRPQQQRGGASINTEDTRAFPSLGS